MSVEAPVVPICTQVAILDAATPGGRRLAALEEVTPEGHGFFLLRSVLLLDRDANLRRRAAQKLIVPEATPFLLEAAEDDKPRVREAALASLARLRAGEAAETAARLALEDPIWSVRRAAVSALFHIAGQGAVPALIGALDDPFWRVRQAAIETLARLGDEAPALQAELGSLFGRTDAARAALERLRRIFSGEPGPIPAPPAPRPNGALFNEDPAVMTARLEDPSFEAPPHELLELLPSSHESLRKLVIERLLDADARVLTAATAWLEDPRVPHAAQAVVTLLARAGDAALEVATRALEGASAGPRTRAWAAAYAGAAGATSLLGPLRAATADPAPVVRAMAVEALAKLGETPSEDRLDDPDPRVRLAALAALVDRAPHLLCDRPFEGPVRARRLLLEAASRCNDEVRLRAAAEDPDPFTRSRALRLLSRAGRLDAQTRDAALADPDPWIRLAVLDVSSLRKALRDPDLEVRRATAELVRRHGDLETLVELAESEDPWCRTIAAERLPSTEVASLLRLTLDPSPAVRGAASDRLDGADVRPVLDVATDPAVRKAAYTRLAASFDEEVHALLEAAEEAEIGEVRDHVTAMLVAFGRAVPVRPPRQSRGEEVAVVPKRPLGRTGIEVAPLAVSGAHGMSPGSLRAAFLAGVNLFFWEPRYHGMTRFIRARPSRRDRLNLVAGTFHAGRRGIEADLTRALSRLGTDRLDVFLLFWVRSAERLSAEAYETLSRLKSEGRIRAFGFSTHDRDLAARAIQARPWDVVMVRHNAAHRGAEEELFPAAERTGTGVLTFSALCYGRMVAGPGAPIAADCYRYSASQPGVAAVISAPRRHRELVENLAVLERSRLTPEDVSRLRAHGEEVYAANKEWAELVRRVPEALPEEAGRRLETYVERSALE